MKNVLAVIAALMMLTGCGAVAESAPVERVEQVVSVPTIEEDDPAWDCWTMGNMICGPVGAGDKVDAQLADAWDKFDAQVNVSDAYRVEYRGLALGSAVLSNEFVAVPTDAGGMFHVFEMIPLT